jgi:hypothetical protein
MDLFIEIIDSVVQISVITSAVCIYIFYCLCFSVLFNITCVTVQLIFYTSMSLCLHAHTCQSEGFTMGRRNQIYQESQIGVVLHP